MTIDEIKAAVDAGKTVRWANPGYVVVRDDLGQYHIEHLQSLSCIGLTNRAGDKLNGRESDFYVEEG